MEYAVRFKAYDHLGPERGLLTGMLQANLVVTKNELPTLTFKYPRRDRAHPFLLDNPEIGVEITTDGVTWVEPRNCRFVLSSNSFDYLEEVETLDYNFVGIGEGMRSVYIWDGTGFTLTDEGKVILKDVTAANMVGRLWDKAKARGWGGDLYQGYQRAFGSESLPNGQEWEVIFDTETTLDGVIGYFVRNGFVDYHWQARSLIVERQGTSEVDTTGDADPLRFHLSGGPAGVDSAPQQGEHAMGLTHVVVIGEENRRFEIRTGYFVPAGRREMFIQHGGVRDMKTAQQVAAPTITRYNVDRKNTTRQFRLNEERVRVLPFVHYNVNHWALAEKEDNNWERMLIRQIGITVDQNGVQGYVSMGDKIDTILEKFDARLQRVQSGLG